MSQDILITWSADCIYVSLSSTIFANTSRGGSIVADVLKQDLPPPASTISLLLKSENREESPFGLGINVFKLDLTDLPVLSDDHISILWFSPEVKRTPKTLQSIVLNMTSSIDPGQFLALIILWHSGNLPLGSQFTSSMWSLPSPFGPPTVRNMLLKFYKQFRPFTCQTWRLLVSKLYAQFSKTKQHKGVKRDDFALAYDLDTWELSIISSGVEDLPQMKKASYFILFISEIILILQLYLSYSPSSDYQRLLSTYLSIIEPSISHQNCSCFHLISLTSTISFATHWLIKRYMIGFKTIDAHGVLILCLLGSSVLKGDFTTHFT